MLLALGSFLSSGDLLVKKNVSLIHQSMKGLTNLGEYYMSRPRKLDQGVNALMCIVMRMETALLGN